MNSLLSNVSNKYIYTILLYLINNNNLLKKPKYKNIMKLFHHGLWWKYLATASAERIFDWMK